ncbi:MAG: transporter, partial [Pirellulaceae bacterium]
MIESDESVLFSAPPTTLRNAKEKAFWNISLEEVVRITLENSEVIRDIGGRIVASPGATKTRLDSALEETNPLSGVEAALSAFDAQFNTSLDLTHDEPAFNNLFFGGGARSLKRRTGLFNLDFTKTAATGTTFTARKQINYDGNNSPANLFPSAYEVTVTGEFRHPLLQGSGVEFNRIAGPQSTPGQYNGVVLARINTDVA